MESLKISHDNECNHVIKGWGEEVILHNGEDFCAKILRFRGGSKASLHFHLKKRELFRVLSGSFILEYVDGETGETIKENISAGANIYIPNGSPHRLYCLEGGDIFESSTQDFASDSIRISPGDSQK